MDSLDVTLLIDPKEMDNTAAYFPEDDGSGIFMKKRRRRVSFAQTQTVHVIPRNDEFDTPPDQDYVAKKQSPPPRRSLMVRVSPHSQEPPAASTSSEDLDQGTCDMDTGSQGSWTNDKEGTTAQAHSSFDGVEEDSDCPIHLWHISRDEEDNSICNDDLNDDITMDATTFTRNLSMFLTFSKTTDSYFREGKEMVQNPSQKLSSDSDAKTDDMALTEPGGPHWKLSCCVKDSLHADDSQSSMSLATKTQVVKWKDRGRLSPGNVGRLDLSAAAQQSPSYMTDGGSIPNLIQDKENFPPQTKQNSRQAKSQTPTLALNNSDVSMSLSNTVDGFAVKRTDVLMDIDGNSKTPISRLSPGGQLQDSTLLVNEVGDTVAVCNLNDLLADYTDYTTQGSGRREIALQSKKDISTPKCGPTETVSMPNAGTHSQSFVLKGQHCHSNNSMDLDGTNSQELGCSEFENEMNAAKQTAPVPLHLVTNGNAVTYDAERQPSSDIVRSKVAAQPIYTPLHKTVHIPVHSRSPKPGVEETYGGAKKQNCFLYTEAPSSSCSRVNASESDVVLVAEPHITQVKEEVASISIANFFPAGTPGCQKSQQFRGHLLHNPQDKAEDTGACSSSKILKVSTKDGTLAYHQQSSKQTVGEFTSTGNHLSSGEKVIGTAIRSGKVVNQSRDPLGSHRQGFDTIDQILMHIEVEPFFQGSQFGEEVVAPLAPTSLQTLRDHLHLSCIVSPQMNLFKQHVQELAAKVEFARKQNEEMKSSKLILQKLLEEPADQLKLKHKEIHKLTRKGWTLWMISYHKQKLSFLEETRDNLNKESEAVRERHQEVLQLHSDAMQACSKLLLKQSFEPTPASESKVIKASTVYDGELFCLKEMVARLQSDYQRACECLMSAKAKFSAVQSKIEGLFPAHKDKFIFGLDKKDQVDFTEKYKSLLRKTLETNSLVKCKELMHVTLKRGVGGKSQTEFFLEDLFYQRFEYEGTGPSAQVKITRLLSLEAIDMAFPCMDASLAFQYVLGGIQNSSAVQIQNLYRLVQRTNFVLGLLIDMLREIKYCRRMFSMSCRFSLRRDDLVLRANLLECATNLKVTLVFDMRSLRGGVYPYDLKPAEIQVHNFGRTLNPILTVHDVNARIAKIRPGFGRIYKVCGTAEKLMKEAKQGTSLA